MSKEQELPHGLTSLVEVQDIFHLADWYFDSLEIAHFNNRPTTDLIPRILDGKVKVRVKTTIPDYSADEIEEMVGRINYGHFAEATGDMASYLSEALKEKNPNPYIGNIIATLVERLQQIQKSAERLRSSHIPGHIGNEEIKILWSTEELFKNDKGNSMEYAGALIHFLESESVS